VGWQMLAKFSIRGARVDYPAQADALRQTQICPILRNNKASDSPDRLR